ncbi:MULTISPECIES: helix-turn-helix transcriptional regulator [unclassified Janthinobacterium]|uniref:helix-turn-helix transcriptional regulator n=1 Tax=unclassified Janthinobacterium TaxID=2610881 RepID=UPI00160CAF66|nr:MULTISPECIES: helix-turn-helix transcriptional regulator [unclassified Janthinobacterium]MBB5370588.1 transcriptional regulator with XRE-family HTH domain [Janthinobacterium sp. K2C7]MBB5383198.1 transcriptional regulator with XRE-family HTH domain [Janthinobacterium sp. K2Li3]MBB5388652.1 transcriptional regulator with XRE-family HTH domain [Janthinobacterium sp. K2E3]
MSSKLAEFIRARREAVTPAMAGLPGGGRRRTPGLRREELAQLCEVSPTWLTWLEQGRPVSASAKMLTRLAQVLQLSVAERAYLFEVADKADPHHREGEGDGAAASELSAIVAAIDAPAYILDRTWNAVAWNTQAASLFSTWLNTEAEAPNQLRFMFLEPCARILVDDWPERARRLVAEFRADIGRHADQVPLAGLIAELSHASGEFRQWWLAQQVQGRDGGLRRFLHPQQGPLAFHQVTLHLARQHELKLVMLLPVP